MNKDIDQIKALIASGHRPIDLNEQRQSPIDVLDALNNIDPQERKALRMALLASQNPTSPTGYTKWEAGHGSPWGLEILLSGALKGGVNGPSGGREALAGQVFFSDRVPEMDTDSTIRKNLRQKTRTYAKAVGSIPSKADNRGVQYRMAQAVLHALDHGKTLQATGKPVSIAVETRDEIKDELKKRLQLLFTNTGFMFSNFRNLELGAASERIKFPTEISVCDKQGVGLEKLSGEKLNRLYADVCHELQSDLEKGKAPFLSLINNGHTVPLVFGFGKVTNLKTHLISTNVPGQFKRYSYQQEDHPLAGSDRGGKLKEIEVKNLQDLATLSVGLLAKGGELPSDIVIRVNPLSKQAKQQSGTRAEYLTMDQVRGFQTTLKTAVAEMEGITEDNVPGHLAKATVASLQSINSRLRSRNLAEWKPSRTDGTESTNRNPV